MGSAAEACGPQGRPGGPVHSVCLHSQKQTHVVRTCTCAKQQGSACGGREKGGAPRGQRADRGQPLKNDGIEASGATCSRTCVGAIIYMWGFCYCFQMRRKEIIPDSVIPRRGRGHFQFLQCCLSSLALAGRSPGSGPSPWVGQSRLGSRF